MNIDVGQVIAGKYELSRLIGKGAMGEVWRATHNSLGGDFAIKLVEPNDDDEAETASGRFQLEAQIAARLSRKTRHIVSVSDHGEENGLAYLVMELLEGESLEERTQRTGGLAPAEVAAIVSQIARALLLVHEEGIFHRDLKPANVWLGKDEDGRLLVKLLDFGIARSNKPFRTRSPFATGKDMVLGTPSYMSPEQARGLDTLDYRCDLWALAVVAYEALTTLIPFDGTTLEDIFLAICTFRVVPVRKHRPELPPEFQTFFDRAFDPQIDQRFASAAELSEAFEQLVSPEEMEKALGLPLTPSGRRLEVARKSDPRLEPTAAAPKIEKLASDLEPVALGEVGLPRRAANGRILAAAGFLAVLLIGVLIVLTSRSPSPPPRAALGDPSPPSSTAPVPTPRTSEATTTPPPPPSANDPAPPATKPDVVSGRPKPPPAVATAARPVAAPPPAAPIAPTPAPAKSVKKDEIF